MIKSISFLARKPGLSRAEFLDHWRNVHAPMCHKVPGLRGYTISVVAQDHSRADVPALDFPEFDGIAQTWYDDAEARAAAAASPEGSAWHRDGGQIIGGIRMFVTREQTVIPVASDPRPRFKALSVIRKKAEHSDEAFHNHWTQTHAEMAKGVPELQGFVLSDQVSTEERADIPTLPLDGPVDGFAESWVHDLEARRRMVASPEAKAWFRDGSLFLGQVRTFVLEETVMVPL